MAQENSKKKFRPHITRKNLIVISLIFFYCLIFALLSVFIDYESTVVKQGNPIQSIGTAFGFPNIIGSTQAYTLVIVIAIYILLVSAAIIFEMRVAKFYENRFFSAKWTSIYIATLIVGAVLGFGIGTLAQFPYNSETIGNSYMFLGECMLIGLIIYLVLAAIIFAACAIVINFKNIDKPFKFFSTAADEAMQDAFDEADEEKHEEQGSLPESFGEQSKKEGEGSGSGAGGAGGGTGVGDGSAETSGGGIKADDDTERIFPGLVGIDYVMEEADETDFEDDRVQLDSLCTSFRNYLCKEEGLYFDIETIRAFISGLAASRLIILEGLSGTGKSSLARYFSEYIGEKSFFEPVQATWRDRTSILGYFNDFSRSYNETEFLKTLYRATFRPRHLNIMVLDELNISRIEYYFADFLSVMEYPMDEWELKILQLPYDFEPPMHLEDGVLEIPQTTWFIGTANKDDSTYTITDKVYDRAITINFDDRNEPFTVKGEVSSIKLSYEKLIALFDEAKANEKFRMDKEDYDNLKKITDFTYNTFDLTFGNRILNQIEQLVPVYVACGGTKESALDFMFARKVIYKLQGRYEDYIKQGLTELNRLITDVYGKDKFPLTRHEISKLLRKL